MADIITHIQDLHISFISMDTITRRVVVTALTLTRRRGVGDKLRRVLRWLLALLLIRSRINPMANGEAIRRRARADAEHAWRHARVVALYTRLCLPDNARDLRTAYAAAPSGPERDEMFNLLRIDHRALEDPVLALRAFRHRIDSYIKEHVEVLEKHEAILGVLRAVAARTRGTPNDKKYCVLSAGPTKPAPFEEGLSAKMLENEKYIDGLGDSDSELWDEKILQNS